MLRHPLGVAVLVLSSCAACLASNAAGEGAAAHRHAEGLGALRSSVTLWAGGIVPYYISKEAVEGGNSLVQVLDDDDEGRIREAIATAEAKTCIRYRDCGNKAACSSGGAPYVAFRAGEGDSRAGLGQRAGENVILLSTLFDGSRTRPSTTGALHEMLHSLGLTHEQERSDRDRYITVDFSVLDADLVSAFELNRDEGRDIGPYDYHSLLHYDLHPGVTAPQEIGHGGELSPGDIETIEFLYHGCSDSLAQPLCTASISMEETTLIPFSRFTVEFNAEWNLGEALDVASTGTAPGAELEQKTWNQGSSVRARVSFTPQESDKGKQYTLAARFTANGAAATCTVHVEVASSENVCFGVSGDDTATVCSGRGECGSVAGRPCTCQSGYGGNMCQGLAGCPDNYYFPFAGNENEEMWKGSEDASFAAAGSGSAKFSSSSSSSSSSGVYTLPTPSKFSRITFYAAVANDALSVAFFGPGQTTSCFSVRVAVPSSSSDQPSFMGLVVDGTQDRASYFKGPNTTKAWIYVDVIVDNEGSRVELADQSIALPSCASAGIAQVHVFGQGWLDEVNLVCYASSTTDAPPPTSAALTNAPPTSAGVTNAPPTSAGVTNAPRTDAPSTDDERCLTPFPYPGCRHCWTNAADAAACGEPGVFCADPTPWAGCDLCHATVAEAFNCRCPDDEAGNSRKTSGCTKCIAREDADSCTGVHLPPSAIDSQVLPWDSAPLTPECGRRWPGCGGCWATEHEAAICALMDSCHGTSAPFSACGECQATQALAVTCTCPPSDPYDGCGICAADKDYLFWCGSTILPIIVPSICPDPVFKHFGCRHCWDTLDGADRCLGSGRTFWCEGLKPWGGCDECFATLDEARTCTCAGGRFDGCTKCHSTQQAADSCSGWILPTIA